MNSIFDFDVVDVHAGMYRAWTTPDLFPDERQPVLSNWHEEDLAAFCGGEYIK